MWIFYAVVRHCLNDYTAQRNSVLFTEGEVHPVDKAGYTRGYGFSSRQRRDKLLLISVPLLHAYPGGDDHLLHLGGAILDLGNFGIAHHAFHGVVPGVTIAAEELQAPAGYVAGILRRDELRRRRHISVLLVGILCAGVQ